jgi:hypothetical protein
MKRILTGSAILVALALGAYALEWYRTKDRKASVSYEAVTLDYNGDTLRTASETFTTSAGAVD